jgi:hypothetical protein
MKRVLHLATKLYESQREMAIFRTDDKRIYWCASYSMRHGWRIAWYVRDGRRRPVLEGMKLETLHKHMPFRQLGWQHVPSQGFNIGDILK